AALNTSLGFLLPNWIQFSIRSLSLFRVQGVQLRLAPLETGPLRIHLDVAVDLLAFRLQLGRRPLHWDVRGVRLQVSRLEYTGEPGGPLEAAPVQVSDPPQPKPSGRSAKPTWKVRGSFSPSFAPN